MAGVSVNTLKVRPDTEASSSLHAWMVPGCTVRRGGVDRCVKQPCAGSARRGGYMVHDGAKPGCAESSCPVWHEDGDGSGSGQCSTIKHGPPKRTTRQRGLRRGADRRPCSTR
jgi:hypothetical protein